MWLSQSALVVKQGYEIWFGIFSTASSTFRFMSRPFTYIVLCYDSGKLGVFSVVSEHTLYIDTWIIGSKIWYRISSDVSQHIENEHSEPHSGPSGRDEGHIEALSASASPHFASNPCLSTPSLSVDHDVLWVCGKPHCHSSKYFRARWHRASLDFSSWCAVQLRLFTRISLASHMNSTNCPQIVPTFPDLFRLAFALSQQPRIRGYAASSLALQKDLITFKATAQPS